MRIKEAREARGYTHADALGMMSGVYRGYDVGRRVPTRAPSAYSRCLADALDVAFAWLLGESDVINAVSDYFFSKYAF